MVSTVRPRPNYYEILGLTASATIEEIRQAFASRTSLFQRPLADSAALAVAFETLRDPAKRKAYDIERGLKAPPEPPAKPAPPAHKPPEVHVSINFIGAMAPKRTDERTVGSVIATSLREPTVDPESLPRAAAPEPRNPRAGEIPDFLRSARNRLVLPADDPAFEWKRPAIALGGVVFGVGVLAAVAGWSAGLVDERDQNATTVELPKAMPRAAKVAAVPSTALPQGIVAAPASRPAPVVAAIRTKHEAPPSQAPAAEQPDPFAGVPVADTSDTDTAPVEAAAATSEPGVQTETASMPLPNAVIARTIGRIGYACGSVASTAPVEGVSGVFKITCTSGHSYQATPVRGRYHFRRLSDR